MKEHSVNFERGVKAAKNGMGVSDAWGDVKTKNSNNIPSKEELDEWIKGWESFHNEPKLTWNDIFAEYINSNVIDTTFAQWLKQNFEPPKPTKNINL
jgi:hypothetical protein